MVDINTLILNSFMEQSIDKHLKDIIIGQNPTNRKEIDKHLNRATLGFSTAGLGTAIDYIGKTQSNPELARAIHGIAFPIAMSGATYGMYHRIIADKKTQRYIDQINSNIQKGD